MWGLGSTVFVFSTLSHLLSFVHHVRYLACAGSNGTFNIEPVIARISHVSLCAGHGWGPGGSGQGQTNPRPAERAGGTSRGPGPPADQEHICDQVCYRSLVHNYQASLWPCTHCAPVAPRISGVRTQWSPPSFHSPLTHASYSPHSYINQRNREWNIVESEKALVVSKTTLSGSLKIILINKTICNLFCILLEFIFQLLK